MRPGRKATGAQFMDISAYHPFRSVEAKERYLSLYDTSAKKWPIDSETRMADTSYGRTFIRISGPADAPPLVLLPGARANSLMWLPNIKAFSVPFRTYAVDSIYDFGRSISTRDLNSLDDYVLWLDELFSVLDLGDEINLIGISYGGWLASQYALRFQNRLRKIVLLAPACTVLSLRLEFLIRAILMSLSRRRYTKSFIYWIFSDLVHKDDVHRELVETMTEGMFMSFRCFKPKQLVNPTVLDDGELRSIRVPALFLVGENEKIYSARKAVQRLNKVAPHIKTGIIPGAGHDLTIVQAEMVNRKVLDFLKQPS
jgi:pimeloyl-ACP methyl ester carboxylesterase